ncbi:YbjQ family protein [bacterium]|nr:YbjQ family protein [bacterium]
MLLTTTNDFSGKTIKEYRGVIFGEVINGIDYGKDIMASFRNFSGGRVHEYEDELIKSRADAINEMISRAEQIGANAIVGVKIDYEPMGAGGMIMVVASGTAVIVEQNN